jgi:hypothetical protein
LVRLGFGLHHLPAGTRFRFGRLRCLAYGGSPVAHAGRGWYRAALEQGTRARGPFAALAAKLRPALVIYGHQHRPHVSAAGQPALVGLGSFRDGQSSAVVLDSDETGRLVRALRRRTATQPEAV